MVLKFPSIFQKIYQIRGNTINRPNSSHPWLIGILVDASASISQASQKQSGLDVFTGLLEQSVQKIKLIKPSLVSENNIDLFAYGFGFDNPVSILSEKEEPAIKSLFKQESPIIKLGALIKDWKKQQAHLKSLAITAQGTSPLMTALEKVDEVFHKASKETEYGLKVLIILSDGLASDAPDYSIAKQAEQLKKHDVVIISLHLSKQQSVKPKILHNRIDPSWDDGAKLLAECASEHESHDYIEPYLSENGWKVYPNGKLFIQINPFSGYTFLTYQHKKSITYTSTKQIIIAYHCHDKTWLEKLKNSLTKLKDKVNIKYWENTKFNTQPDWYPYIDEELRQAKIVVLLISNDFLHSPFTQNTDFTILLSQANNDQTNVIPIILNPCGFNFADNISRYSPINNPYQPLSSLSDQDQKQLIDKLVLLIEQYI